MRHLRSRGEGIHGEVAQMVAFAHRYVYLIVVATGHVMERQHFAQGQQPGMKRVEVGARMALPSRRRRTRSNAVEGATPTRPAKVLLGSRACLRSSRRNGAVDSVEAQVFGHKLITPAVSLGSVDTLIQHPGGLRHRAVDEATRRNHGITPGVLRVSVGIEHVEDRWTDLEQALQSVQQARTA